jgi:X-X-X-Leu-X-X-Gly heptad repeat protein
VGEPLEADYAALTDGATKAANGGEEIAGGAKTLFGELESMNYDLVGEGGSAFQRVQTVMMENLKIIDDRLNEVHEGITNSSHTFQSDDSVAADAINKSLGSDTVGLLTNGQ